MNVDLKGVILILVILIIMASLLSASIVSLKRGTDESSRSHDYIIIAVSIGWISVSIIGSFIYLILTEKSEHDIIADRYKKLSHAIGIMIIIVMSIFSILAYERLVSGADGKTNEDCKTETLISAILGFVAIAGIVLYAGTKARTVVMMQNRNQ